jgi:hypothetical protein
MPVDPRGIYDVLLERMVSALETYRDEQAAIDPAATFEVFEGGFRGMQQQRVPWVSVSLAQLRSADNTASSPGQWDATATYHVDLVANGKTSATGARGDRQAYRRLMYLIQQVLNAIYASERIRMQYTGEEIQLEWPDVQIVEPESFAEELPLVGARIRIDARVEYTPAQASGETMTELSVSTDEWSALYEYGG